MARVDLRHPANAAGDWFVDERCIDCGTCRELAPPLFADALGPVGREPAAGLDRRGEVTTRGWPRRPARRSPSARVPAAAARDACTPARSRPGRDVFDCGYCSPDSFGATAWFAAATGRQRARRLAPLHRGPRRVRSTRWAASTTSCSPTATTSPTPTAGRERSAPGCGSTPTTRAAAPFATDVVQGSTTSGAPPGCVGRPDARPHAGLDGLPARRHVPVHRRLAGVEPRAAGPDRLPRTRAGGRGRRRPTRWRGWPTSPASRGSCPATAPGCRATTPAPRPPRRPRRAHARPLTHAPRSADRPSRAYVRWPH